MSLVPRIFLILLALTTAACAAAPDEPKPVPAALGKAKPPPAGRPPVPAPVTAPDPATIDLNYYPRQPRDWLEAQIELARRGFSSGSIDGLRGPQSVAALRAFQRSEELEDSGFLDDATREALVLTAPAVETRTLSAAELASVQPLAKTWLGKSEQTALAHDNVLELAAEKFHAHPNLLKRLNPDLDWSAVTPETKLTAPNVERVGIAGKAARLHVRLADHEIEATDEDDRVIAHFPVSIARDVEKRPVGELHVTVVIADPNYTFDPAVFPESPEARELGRKLILAPGPNNPVGVAWIGLDRPGYGIHGTPEPEKVGRTESHGCFRLANWDARTLLDLAWVGLPVEVEP